MPAPKGRTAFAIAAAIVSTAGIAWVDFATGVEVRVFPLYFLPISLMALGGAGRTATLIMAAVSTCTWYQANVLAGMHLPPLITAINVVAQGTAFLLVWAI